MSIDRKKDGPEHLGFGDRGSAGCNWVVHYLLLVLKGGNNMTGNKWTFAGTYNGEGVYYHPETKAIAIEKDHQYLVEPSPEEKVGIYKKYANEIIAKAERRDP